MIITSDSYLPKTPAVEPDPEPTTMKEVTPHDDLFKFINQLSARVDALDGGAKEEVKPIEFVPEVPVEMPAPVEFPAKVEEMEDKEPKKE